MTEGWGELSRTHYCGALREDDIGREVVLAGWMHSRRDHGGVIFIDLRDREGVSQIVFNPETDADLHARAGDVRGEWVLAVKGLVRERPEGTVNPDLATGAVEVGVTVRETGLDQEVGEMILLIAPRQVVNDRPKCERQSCAKKKRALRRTDARPGFAFRGHAGQLY